MKARNRSASLAFGLVIAGGLSLGATDARRQYRQPPTPAPTYIVAAPRAYVPVVPRYTTPTYSSHQNGYYQPVRGSRGAAFTKHYGYEAARRDLKLYKPWLSRD